MPSQKEQKTIKVKVRKQRPSKERNVVTKVHVPKNVYKRERYRYETEEDS